MEQHDIDTFIAMAQRQHGQEPSVPFTWVATAMKYAYNKGVEDVKYNAEGREDGWFHDDDDIPF